MPLQIRRGTAAERDALSSPLVIGELLYTTDTGRLYVGDGTALGGPDSQGNPGEGGKGLTVTDFTTEDAQDAAATLFANGTHSNISFTYNDSADSISAAVDLSSYSGNISVDGTLSVTGNLQAAAFKGSIFADDSTLLVDAVSGSIPYSVISGTPTALSEFTNDVGYIRVADIDDGTVTIDVNNTGDLQGSVYGDDSTLLVDAVNSTIPASVVTGTFTGNVIGNVLGELTGNVLGNVTGNVTGNVLGNVLGELTGNVLGNVTGNVLGDVTGTMYGNVFGNVTGNVSGTAATVTIAAQPAITSVGTLINLTVSGDITSNSVITSTINSSDSSAITISSPVTIDAVTNISSTLTVTDEGTFQSANSSDFPLSITAAHSDALSTRFTIRKSRGTLASPTTLINQDRIGSMVFSGYDGSTFYPSASIQARVSGTVSTGIVPGSLRFLITAQDGTENEAMTINQVGNVFMYARAAVQAPLQIYSAHETGSSPSRAFFIRQRGTFASPTVVTSTDPIFELDFLGYDGSTNTTAAKIRATVNGTVSSGVVPGKLDLYASDSTGTSAVRVSVESTKTTFSNMPVLPTYADDTAADTAIGGAGNRVNGMMFYNTALGAIRAVVGGSWTSL